MGTFDVTLPAKQKVVFPARCVVCEKEDPDGTLELSFLGAEVTPLVEMAVEQVIFQSGLDTKYYGSNTTTRVNGVPVCHGCKAGLKRYHSRLKIGYYTAWIPGAALILLGVPLGIGIPLLLLFAASPGILALVFPPSFGASFYSGKANFEFRSRKVAAEFAHLNDKSLAEKSETPKSDRET